MTTSEHQPLLQSTHEDCTAISIVGQETSPPDARWKTAKSELKFRLPAVLFNFVTTGVGQSAVGALIPDIETYYDLKNGPTALIFPSAIAGYLLAVCVMQPLHLRFGRRGIAVLGPAIRLVASVMLACGVPFPVALASYFIFGYGTGFTDAGFCSWGGGVPYANIVQGAMHGSWSAGCVVGPLIAVKLTGKGLPWYGFYRLLACLCVLELVALGLAFRQDNALRYRTPRSDDEQAAKSFNPLRSKLIWLCGLFWIIDVGIEACYGVWIVTYMGNVRHVERIQAAGAASTFWIGMCTGRIVLSGFTEYFGVERSVTAYIIIAVLVQFSIKFVTSIPAVFGLLACVGFFFGPYFPSGIVLLAKKLPFENHVAAISTAAAMGQIGGAVAPLAIGFMADLWGIARLIDVVTVLSALLLFAWTACYRLD